MGRYPGYGGIREIPILKWREGEMATEERADCKVCQLFGGPHGDHSADALTDGSAVERARVEEMYRRFREELRIRREEEKRDGE